MPLILIACCPKDNIFLSHKISGNGSYYNFKPGGEGCFDVNVLENKVIQLKLNEDSFIETYSSYHKELNRLKLTMIIYITNESEIQILNSNFIFFMSGSHRIMPIKNILAWDGRGFIDSSSSLKSTLAGEKFKKKNITNNLDISDNKYTRYSLNTDFLEVPLNSFSLQWPDLIVDGFVVKGPVYEFYLE